MGKKSDSPPPPPDPTSAINAQSAANVNAANANARNSAVDQYTPYGTITYARDKNGVPTSMTQRLSAQGQRIYDKQMGVTETLTNQASSRIGQLPTTGYSTAGTPYDPSKYGDNIMPDYVPADAPYNPTQYGDLETYSKDAADAAFNQSWSRLEPAQSQEFDRRVQWLSDQGLPVGGEAWNKSYGEMERAQTDARQSAANNAVMIGGQEAERKLAMEQGLRSTAMQEGLQTHQQQAADKTNEIQTQQNLRNQILQELLTNRTQNFNEASAYLTGAPALGTPQMPNAPTYNMQAPNVIGAMNSGFENQMASYNARNAQNSSNWQGAANVAGAMAMKSSRKFKDGDVLPKPMLERVIRIPVRTWRYKKDIGVDNALHIGPYAEDWAAEIGLGNGEEISIIDAVGVLVKCVQELKAELDELKGA